MTKFFISCCQERDDKLNLYFILNYFYIQKQKRMTGANVILEIKNSQINFFDIARGLEVMFCGDLG